MPGGIPRGSPGHPPGGGAGPGGPPGTLFEKLPTIGRSALKLQHRIAAKSKPKSMEGIAKIAIWVLKMFLSRSLNQFFENYSKKEARHRGGYYKNVDPGTQRIQNRKHFPNPWPEIVEGITKTAIRELVNHSQR